MAKIILQQASSNEISTFRQMVEQYWHILMPKSEILSSPARKEEYFQKCFKWDGANDHPHWVIHDDCKIGFISYRCNLEEKRAAISNLFIEPNLQRKGFGAGAVRALLIRFDNLGIERIDINVRRDNPSALRFWRSQSFGIAGFRLRQYRDPINHIAFQGALSSDFND